MRKTLKVWILRLGPALAIMAIIFLASSVRGSEMPEFGIWDLLVKKGGHSIGYALLATAYCHALAYNKRASRIDYVIAFCLAAFYATTDEWHQRFTPGRTSSIQDVGIDSIGAFIGLALRSRILIRFFKPNKTIEP
jgi:VanZ family protein